MSDDGIRVSWRPLTALIPSWEQAFYDAVTSVDRSGRIAQPTVGQDWEKGGLIVISYNAAEHASVCAEKLVDRALAQVTGQDVRIALSACGHSEGLVTRMDVSSLLKVEGNSEYLFYPNRAEQPGHLTDFVNELLEVHPRINLERKRGIWRRRLLGGPATRGRSAEPDDEWLIDQ